SHSCGCSPEAPPSCVMNMSPCKMVVVGDSECGKTALLSVFAKDCYVPTVFENYTTFWTWTLHRVELRLWDTSGSPYYDNVRPLTYPDADMVLICFDISRPETLDSVLRKWRAEVKEFCPDTRMLLVGCKLDLRTDLFTRSHSRQTPVSYDQGFNTAKQLSVPYLECSSLQSETSIRDIFHMATLACVSKDKKSMKRRKSSCNKRTSVVGGGVANIHKPKARSCVLM
uniref:Rho-related GTP-binding protein RhoE-like n=1 Tax=Gouania willdenowi TaxID=441366 RepID=A0A8C5I710_GOUWI